MDNQANSKIRIRHGLIVLLTIVILLECIFDLIPVFIIDRNPYVMTLAFLFFVGPLTVILILISYFTRIKDHGWVKFVPILGLVIGIFILASAALLTSWGFAEYYWAHYLK